MVLLDHRSPFDYSIFKTPQNWLHKGLIKVSWVRLSFSPPCLPCSHGGKTYCGIKRECIDCSLYFPSCISGRSRQYHGWTGKGQRKKQLSSSTAVCTRCHSYIKTLVRVLTWAVFIYRWSDLKTNHPVWKYWLLWSTPIHEQPNLTAESSKCLEGPRNA